MKISETIERLEHIQERHGDVELLIADEDGDVKFGDERFGFECFSDDIEIEYRIEPKVAVIF